MTATWEQAKLGDLVETQKGYAFKSGWFCDSGRPIVKVSDFTDDSVDSTTLVCIPESIATDYQKYELRAGDVVVQTVGSWPSNPASVVGKCVRTPNDAAGALLNQNAVKLSPTDSLDRRFLFYLLRNEDFKTYIIGTAQGAASQAAITLEAIRGYEFEFPPLHVQQQIADILSTYDELIKNNQRRIRILEEMARTLYREWFVHFRFPGHEKISHIASSFGDIPQGWKLGKLADICHIIPGYAFKSKDWQGDGVPVIKIKNIQQDNTIDTDSVDFVSEDVFQATHSKFLLGNGDILIAMTGATAGKLGKLRTKQRFLLNQRVAKIIPDDVYRAFIWCAISTDESKDRFFRLADGAAQPNMSGSQIEDVEIILPTRDLAEAFSRIAEPILNQSDILYLKIQNLRQTRDFLLPRLLSGQVELAE